MSRIYLPILVFVVLVMEGTIFQLVTPSFSSADVILVPRFLVVLIVIIGIHLGRSSGIVYGIIFGLIYDIVYTQLLGVYMFGFTLIGYIFSLHHKRIQDSLLIQLLIIVVAVAFFDSYQFGLYRLIGITDMMIEPFLSERLLPSIILNSAFAIIVYYPVRRLIEHRKKQINIRQR